MAKKQFTNWFTDEIAEFLATCPSREELLAYRPTAQVQERLGALLAKSKNGALSPEEEWELNQFEHLEILVQSIKARLLTRRSVPS